MKTWLAVFALALAVVIGFASGPFGTISFLLTFLTARYLFAARELGFERAWTAFGVELSPPLWQRRNWRWLDAIFRDDDEFWKASSVAVGLTALSLMLSPTSVGIVAVVIATCYVAEIARPTAPIVRLPANANLRTLPTTPMTTVVRVIAAPPAATQKPAAPAASAPAQPAPAPSPAPAAAVIVAPAPAAAAAQPERRPETQPTPPGPLRQPPQQRALRQTQPRDPAQQKPRRNRPLRQPAKRLSQPKRSPLQPLSQLPSRRPDQPSKKRPLRKPSQRRPPLRAGRPARQQPRLATHRPGKKLHRRKTER